MQHSLASKTMMAQVTVIQRVLPHYRVPFFTQLRARLESEDIGLNLVYGQQYPGTVPTTVDFDVPWATRIKNRYWRRPKLELVWQPAWSFTRNSDLVVIEQANRLLFNYLLLLRRTVDRSKLAYWGHGRHFQATPEKHRYREWVKSLLLSKVDWWFTYTQLSADVIKKSGYPANQITVVDNAIDTNELKNARDNTNSTAITELLTTLRLKGKNTCLYCGGMYSDKRLPFLLAACQQIEERVPDFEMLFIGGGPDQALIERAEREHSSIRYLGPIFGTERVPYFLISKAVLMPGLVGLAILDSFVLATPLITTNAPIHSPEISYLRHGVNGIMTDNTIDAYARAVVDYLGSETIQHRLRQGCRESATKYTIENMVSNFVAGIKKCLALR